MPANQTRDSAMPEGEHHWQKSGGLPQHYGERPVQKRSQYHNESRLHVEY